MPQDGAADGPLLQCDLSPASGRRPQKLPGVWCANENKALAWLTDLSAHIEAKELLDAVANLGLSPALSHAGAAAALTVGRLVGVFEAAS